PVGVPDLVQADTQMLGDFRVRGRVAEILDEGGTGFAHPEQQFLHGPLDVDLPALVPEMPLDLPGDARLRVRGQVAAERRVEVVDRLEQPDVADLHQLFFRFRAVPVTARTRADQRTVAEDQSLAGGRAAPGSGRQGV